jgi:hypothetical protein
MIITTTTPDPWEDDNQEGYGPTPAVYYTPTLPGEPLEGWDVEEPAPAPTPSTPIPPTPEDDTDTPLPYPWCTLWDDEPAPGPTPPPSTPIPPTPEDDTDTPKEGWDVEEDEEPAPGHTPPPSTPIPPTPEDDTDTPEEGWAWGPMSRKLHNLREQVWGRMKRLERLAHQAQSRWKAWDRERKLAASLSKEITVLKRQNEETSRAIKKARKRLQDDQTRVLREAEREGRKVKIKTAEELLKEWGIK